jgi:hypothetical protein
LQQADSARRQNGLLTAAGINDGQLASLDVPASLRASRLLLSCPPFGADHFVLL